jgi:putative transposase
MSRARSISTGKPFGMARICREWGIPRSTVYARRHSAAQGPQTPAKRGPKTAYSDAELTDEIRYTIQQSPFTGEGHRKIWARLRQRGIPAGQPRVLRLMREADLLAPYRPCRDLGPRVHDGTIVTEVPDVMWATDATSTWLPGLSQVTVFAVVDHCGDECLGLHAARPGTRFEALEPIRQAVRRIFGDFREGIAGGLALRHDHGSQYLSDDFQREIRFLGMEPSPAFVYAPEGNGVVERFFRTLKEQFLWVHDCRTLEELNEQLEQWRQRYNEQWLIERHGHRSPAEVRRAFQATEAAA